MAMDGSEFTKIAETGMMWPNAITIDYYSQRVFVGDSHLGEIYYMNYDGSNRHHVPIKVCTRVYVHTCVCIIGHEIALEWNRCV
jgi:hypothetical protein